MVNFFQLNCNSKSLIISDTCQLQITILNENNLQPYSNIAIINTASPNPNISYYKWLYPSSDFTTTQSDLIVYDEIILSINDTLNFTLPFTGNFIVYLKAYDNENNLICETSVELKLLDINGCNAIIPTCELVCNGDFEYFDMPIINVGNFYPCVDGSGPINNLLYGTNTMYPSGSTDIFSSLNSWNNNFISGCAQINPIDVPFNFAGNEVPFSGNSYCGIYVYSGNVNPNTPYREYVKQKLTAPLLNGQYYFVSYAVSLAENSAYAIENIDLSFGHGTLTNQFSTITPSSNGILGNSTASGLPSQISPSLANSNGIITNNNGWTIISGTYQATGDETELAIGNFRSDANTNASFIAPNSCLFNYGYYYVDKVSVLHILQPLTLSASQTLICNGNSVTITAPSGFTFYSWSNGQNGSNLNSITVSPTITTTYTLTVFDPVCGGNVTQSITITVGNTNVNAGLDQTICAGASINLSATSTTPNVIFNWYQGNNLIGTGQTISNITPTSPTTYTVIATDPTTGCTASDNISVSFFTTTPLTFSAPNSSCCTNGTISVNPDYVIYSWSISPGISIPGQGTSSISPMLDPNTSYDICLSAIDANGCKIDGCIHVEACCTPNEVFPANTQEFGICSNSPLLYSQIGLNANNNYFVFYQDLIIDQNVYFDDVNVRMAPGTRIIVNPPFTLEFGGTIIKALCPEMWEGIIVSDPAARVVFSKSAEIWDAINAVYSENGGDYQISDFTKMVNNHRSLVVVNFTGIHSGIIELSDVFTDPSNLYAPHLGERMYQGVFISNGGKVTIGNKVNFTNMDYGVYSIDANVDVLGNTFDQIDRPTGISPCALCPAPIGTSIYAGTKLTFLPKNLNVGSTLAGDFNIIKNGYIGIESNGRVNQKSIKNKISKMEEAGIVMMNGKSVTNAIEFNDIKQTKFGIHSVDMPFSRLTITNNDINASMFSCTFPCLENIGIMIENVLTPDMEINISDNTITKKRKGIYLRNITTTIGNWDLIYNNTIDFPQLSNNQFGSAPFVGIELTGCKYVTADENTITKPGIDPVIGMTTSVFGVKSTNSFDCVISQNMITKMGSGVTAKDGNLNTVIVCNEFTKCYTGIDFDNAKINNHLPAPTNYSQRNKWINNIGIYRLTGAIVSGPINFWYSNGLFQNPYPVNVSALTFLFGQPGLSNSNFNVCGTLYSVPPDQDRSNKLEAVVQGNDSTSIYTSEHKWQNKIYAYHKLKKNPSWLNLLQTDDVYYQSYLQLNSNQFVGKSYLIDSLMQIGDLSYATIQLSQLFPTNYIEENVRKTDSIYLEYISDSMGVISNQDDYNFLYDLALMDPLIAGPSVYSARVLLQLDPNDAINASRKYNSDKIEGENNTFDFIIMPNPSNENTQIVFSETIEFKISVFDIEGRLIQNLSGNSNRCLISTLELETGFYLIQIESIYGIKSSKISVVHH